MENYLGIELGSTRIKAVMIDENHRPVKTGDYSWKSSYENGVWTYDLQQAWEGLRAALADFSEADEVAAVGISGMKSEAFEYFMEILCQAQGVSLRQCFASSFCIWSADRWISRSEM